MRPPLRQLLEELRAAGLEVGVEEHLAVQRLLAVEREWTEARLRDALRVLLARSPEEREVFDRVTSRWFSALPARTGLPRGARPRPSAWPVALGVLGLLLVAVAVTSFVWWGSQPQPEAKKRLVDGTQRVESVTARPALPGEDLLFEADWMELVVAPSAEASGDPAEVDLELAQRMATSARTHAGLRDYWRTLDARRDDYAYVVGELQDAGLPEVFAGLPFALSGWGADGDACSAGIWAFDIEPARSLGLAVDGCDRVMDDPKAPGGTSGVCLVTGCAVDEREDIAAATHAAIELLSGLWSDPRVQYSGEAVPLTLAAWDLAVEDPEGGAWLEAWTAPRAAGAGTLSEQLACTDASAFCPRVFEPAALHRSYTAIAQHVLARCWYGTHAADEHPIFEEWASELGPDCAEVLPEREEVAAAPAELAPVPVVPVVTVEPQEQRAPTAELAAAGGVVALVLVAAIVVILRRRRADAAVAPPLVFELRLSAEQPPRPLDPSGLHDLAARVGWSGDQQANPDLDARASARATAARAGRFEPVFHAGRERNRVLALIQLDGPGTAVAWELRGLFEQLGEAGLAIDVLGYRGTPWSFGPVERPMGSRLDQLEAMGVTHVVVVGSSDAAADPGDGRAAAWVDDLAEVPRVTWLEPTAERSWSWGADALMAAGVTVRPASWESVLALDGVSQALPPRWAALLDRAPESSRGEQELRDLLGAAFPLLCVAALLPVTSPGAVGWLLQHFAGGLSPAERLRFVALPWWREGELPAALRERLEALAQAEHAGLLAEVDAAFLAELERQEPPPDTGSWLGWRAMRAGVLLRTAPGAGRAEVAALKRGPTLGRLLVAPPRRFGTLTVVLTALAVAGVLGLAAGIAWWTSETRIHQRAGSAPPVVESVRAVAPNHRYIEVTFDREVAFPAEVQLMVEGEPVGTDTLGAPGKRGRLLLLSDGRNGSDERIEFVSALLLSELSRRLELVALTTDGASFEAIDGPTDGVAAVIREDPGPASPYALDTLAAVLEWIDDGRGPFFDLGYPEHLVFVTSGLTYDPGRPCFGVTRQLEDILDSVPDGMALDIYATPSLRESEHGHGHTLDLCDKPSRVEGGPDGDILAQLAWATGGQFAHAGTLPMTDFLEGLVLGESRQWVVGPFDTAAADQVRIRAPRHGIDFVVCLDSSCEPDFQPAEVLVPTRIRAAGISEVRWPLGPGLLDQAEHVATVAAACGVPASRATIEVDTAGTLAVTGTLEARQAACMSRALEGRKASWAGMRAEFSLDRSVPAIGEGEASIWLDEASGLGTGVAELWCETPTGRIETSIVRLRPGWSDAPLKGPCLVQFPHGEHAVYPLVAGDRVRCILQDGLPLCEPWVEPPPPVEPPEPVSQPTGATDAVGSGDAPTVTVTGPSATVVRTAQPAAEPLLDEDQTAASISKTIRKYSGQVKYCYERALAEDETLSGRIEAAFTIREGRVTDLAVTSDDIEDEDLLGCVELRMKSWRFDSGIIEEEIVYPFILQND